MLNTNTKKTIFLFSVIAGFLFSVYWETMLDKTLELIEISQACDNNRTACEMRGVEI